MKGQPQTQYSSFMVPISSPALVQTHFSVWLCPCLWASVEMCTEDMSICLPITVDTIAVQRPNLYLWSLFRWNQPYFFCRLLISAMCVSVPFCHFVGWTVWRWIASPQPHVCSARCICFCYIQTSRKFVMWWAAVERECAAVTVLCALPRYGLWKSWCLSAYESCLRWRCFHSSAYSQPL